MFGGIEKKVIVVTGACGLIGANLVKLLHNLNVIVIAVDLRKGDCKGVNYYISDITKPENVDDLLKQVLKKYNRIDGLVNLAYPRTPDWGLKFENIPLDSWRENVEIQMNSVFYLCQKVLITMKKQKSGSIVNIGSIYGVVGNDFNLYEDYGGTSAAAYSAIKGGIINFTRYLASYYGKYNIRINCVSPGGVLDKKNQHSSFIDKYSKKSPLGRLANPEEIAPSIVFLLSEHASFITGHNLMVDGGWTII